MTSIRSLLEASRDQQRGIVVHLAGGPVALVVSEVGDDLVIGRNREHAVVAVRIDRIDAVGA